MWTVNIVKGITDNILLEEDQQICQQNAIYPSGFNLWFNLNNQTCAVAKLTKYMRSFNPTLSIGQTSFQNCIYSISTMRTSKWPFSNMGCPMIIGYKHSYAHMLFSCCASP